MTPLNPADLPNRIMDVSALEDLLSRPSQALIDDLATLDGDIIILGVGGKSGPAWPAWPSARHPTSVLSVSPDFQT